MPGQVDALVALEHSADKHRAGDLIAKDGIDLHVHTAVINQQDISGIDVPGQAGIGAADTLSSALSAIADCDHNFRPGLPFDGMVVLEPAGADLRTLQVGEHGYRALEVLADLAHQLEAVQVVGMIAMRHVEARDIHAGLEHGAKNLLVG